MEGLENHRLCARTLAQKLCRLRQNIRQHEEEHIETMFLLYLDHVRSKTFFQLFKLVRIQRADLTNTESYLSCGEALEILIKDLLLALSLKIASCRKHIGCILVDINSCCTRKCKTCHAVCLCTGRGAEQKCIGNDCTAQKTCGLAVDLQIVLVVHLVNNRRRTSKRLIAEKYR